MTTVPEESTLFQSVAFKESDGTPVLPTSATWTLSDCEGNIINSRQDVAFPSLDYTVTITLSGDDLAIQSGESPTDTTTVNNCTASLYKRKFTVKSTVNTATMLNAPVNYEECFYVQGLLNVP